MFPHVPIYNLSLHLIGCGQFLIVIKVDILSKHPAALVLSVPCYWWSFCISVIQLVVLTSVFIPHAF